MNEMIYLKDKLTIKTIVAIWTLYFNLLIIWYTVNKIVILQDFVYILINIICFWVHIFSNSDKHFPNILIDRVGLFCSFHAPDFSCPICLAI